LGFAEFKTAARRSRFKAALRCSKRLRRVQGSRFKAAAQRYLLSVIGYSLRSFAFPDN